MKSDYIKIFSLLIILFFVKFLEFRNINKENKKKDNNNKSENDYFRLLKNEYDTSNRENDDKESIEQCQDIDEDYFSFLLGKKPFTFDKYVDKRDSVNNIFIIIFL